MDPPRRNTPDATPDTKAPDDKTPDTKTAPNARPGVPGKPFVPPGQNQDKSDRNDDRRGTDGPRKTQEDNKPGVFTGPTTTERAPSPANDSERRGDIERRDRERREAFERRDERARRDDFNRPGRPGYIEGGFRGDNVRSYDEVRRDRREFNEGGRTFIREPGRIIVRDRDAYFIRHDENERFRYLDRNGYRSERRGGDTITYLDRPGGIQIVTVVDDDGRLVRRSRRFRDGREVVIIDNGFGGPQRPIYEDVVDLPPPDIRIPRERYIVNYDGADERQVYEALSAPPVAAVDRRYTLDQVRYSPQLRARMRSVDIDTVTFDTGSFDVTPDQASRLGTIAAAINQAVKANPQEVFLIEGYTDAVGNEVDNLSLSDRRAQSVATVLTQNFQVPPENLTTQGYGEQSLKVNTQEASRENRRVTVRRITPLIQQQEEAAAPPRR